MLWQLIDQYFNNNTVPCCLNWLQPCKSFYFSRLDCIFMLVMKIKSVEHWALETHKSTRLLIVTTNYEGCSQIKCWSQDISYFIHCFQFNEAIIIFIINYYCSVKWGIGVGGQSWHEEDSECLHWSVGFRSSNCQHQTPVHWAVTRALWKYFIHCTVHHHHHSLQLYTLKL